MSEPFAYDAVEYPSSGLPLMHPSHLLAVARMFGCRPAPVDCCRYLEYGCGDGTHLVACAMGLPDATFVGVDLSGAAIARGQQLIAELGVTNIQLVAADVTAWTPPGGEYDYACAHGLYSWVPPVVRDAVLAGMHAALAPHGIGYVSYNTYPGSYLRRTVWEMMRHHTDHISDPPRKVREATDLLKFLLAGLPAEGRSPPVSAFAHEMTGLLGRNPAVVYHDDLSGVNDPVYFHQFVAHAGRYGLRFVAEAEHALMNTGTHPPAAAEVLNGMAAEDVTRREQYSDFLKLRRFRQTILAKDGRPPLAEPDPAAATGLLASSQLTVEGDASDLRSAEVLSFQRKERVARTADPLTKATMLTLAEVSPKRLPFDVLLAEVVGRLGRTEPTADDREQLCGILTETWMSGLLDLHGHVPSYAEVVSERPIACPFARNRAAAGVVVTTRLFKHQQFDDALMHVLVRLDGTRTAAQLTTELVKWFPSAERPDPAALRPQIEASLREMARNGLLVG